MENYIKGYIVSNKAYYAQHVFKKEIPFGLYNPNGGEKGSLVMEWKYLDNKESACLKSFHDTWVVLAEFSDVIAELGKLNNKNITQEQFIKILDSCGFTDMTEYTKK